MYQSGEKKNIKQLRDWPPFLICLLQQLRSLFPFVGNPRNCGQLRQKPTLVGTRAVCLTVCLAMYQGGGKKKTEAHTVRHTGRVPDRVTRTSMKTYTRASTLLMGADYYETEADKRSLAARGSVPIGIGRDSHIKRAIIDKNTHIGDNVKIINRDDVKEAARETEGYFIKSGIVTIIKDALITSGTVI